ncbi:hypothetical protein BO78DRAFT_468680, partial [Aspergillus sclerotiicarbonarius CBS 121057]
LCLPEEYACLPDALWKLFPSLICFLFATTATGGTTPGNSYRPPFRARLRAEVSLNLGSPATPQPSTLTTITID